MIDVLILNFKIFVKNVHFLSKYKSSIDLTSKRPNTQNQIIKELTQNVEIPDVKNCKILNKNVTIFTQKIFFSTCEHVEDTL